jgi:hypothetical protein
MMAYTFACIHPREIGKHLAPQALLLTSFGFRPRFFGKESSGLLMEPSKLSK